MEFARLEEEGFEVVSGAFTFSEVAELLEALPAVPAGTAGSRGLHELPWMSDFATGSAMGALARQAIGDAARAVRILFFDKQPGSNWKLPYHQDLTIAVMSREEVDGYGPWSVKDDMVHVQPPASVLERMVAVRLHLDACRADNGALRVIPRSHRGGKLPVADIDASVGNRFWWLTQATSC